MQDPDPRVCARALAAACGPRAATGCHGNSSASTGRPAEPECTGCRSRGTEKNRTRRARLAHAARAGGEERGQPGTDAWRPPPPLRPHQPRRRVQVPRGAFAWLLGHQTLSPAASAGPSGAGKAVPVRGASRDLRSATGRKPPRLAAGSGPVSGGGKPGAGADGGSLAARPGLAGSARSPGPAPVPLAPRGRRPASGGSPERFAQRPGAHAGAAPWAFPPERGRRPGTRPRRLTCRLPHGRSCAPRAARREAPALVLRPPRRAGRRCAHRRSVIRGDPGGIAGPGDGDSRYQRRRSVLYLARRDAPRYHRRGSLLGCSEYCSWRW